MPIMPFLEKKLHVPVSFIVLPLFALANTAIQFPGEFESIKSKCKSWYYGRIDVRKTL